MLGSMNPLGERTRNYKWLTTVLYFVTGSTLGGLALGASLGALGAALPRLQTRASVVVIVFILLLGGLLDSGSLWDSVVTIRRQVNDQWLLRYRSWVYGLGFGFQLGLGVVTIVETWAIYVTFAASFISQSPAIGGIIGMTFGVIRAMPILTVASVRHPEQLGRVWSRLEQTTRSSRTFTWVSQILIGAAGALLLVSQRF